MGVENYKRNFGNRIGLVRIGAIIVFVVFIAGGLFGCGGDGDVPPDYKSLLKDASRYVADLEQKNTKLTAKLKEVTGKAEGKTDDSEPEVAAPVDEAFNLLTTENETLKQEKEALVAEIAAIKAKENLAKTKKVASLEAKNKSLTGKKAVYEEEIAKLRKKVKDNERLAEVVEELTKGKDQLLKQKDALEKEIADLRAELLKAEQLKEKIITLEKENKTLSDLNTAIKSRMEKIQKIMSGDKKK